MIDSNLTTISQQRQKRRALYPEVFTKTHNASPQKPHFANNYRVNKEIFETTLNAGLTFSCTAGYIKGQCQGGNVFLKAVFCGREWCDNCGRDGSPSHQRRIARWIPKAEQIKSMAYIVITIPEAIRDNFKNKKALTDFRTYVKRKLQRDGYGRGLIRWHYFGDCQRCKGGGCYHCNDSGTSNKYHPHLNILTDGGRIKRADFIKYMETWRHDLGRYFDKVSSTSGQIGIINYQFTRNQYKKAHLLKYVTRATHRNFNKEIATALNGYRTTSTWGKWKTKTNLKTENTNLVNLERNLCPCCKKPLTWQAGHYITDLATGEIKYKRRLISAKELQPDKLKHLAAGYYIKLNQ